MFARRVAVAGLPSALAGRLSQGSLPAFRRSVLPMEAGLIPAWLPTRLFLPRYSHDVPDEVDPPISVTKTVYTVTDFLGWQRQGILNLRPYFQRGDVWTPKAKSYLIDTLIRGYPVPIIYLQNKQDRRTITNVRQVVDGQQRLRTILAFIEPEILDNLTDRDRFSILKSHNPNYAGMSFRDLPPKVQDTITDTELSCHVLPATLSDKHLLQLFARLNSTGEKLNDQELRNAEYHGEFKALAYEISYDQIDRWQEWGIFSPRYLAQMRDVELTSELMITTMVGVQAKSKLAIDNVYRRFEDQFPEARAVYRRVAEGFNFLEDVYRHGDDSSVRKLQTQSWVYTIFAAFDMCRHKEPIMGYEGPLDNLYELTVSPKQLRHQTARAAQFLSEQRLPEKLAKALRGASTDTASRAARLEFLLTV